MLIRGKYSLTAIHMVDKLVKEETEWSTGTIFMPRGPGCRTPIPTCLAPTCSGKEDAVAVYLAYDPVSGHSFPLHPRPNAFFV